VIRAISWTEHEVGYRATTRQPGATPTAGADAQCHQLGYRGEVDTGWGPAWCPGHASSMYAGGFPKYRIHRSLGTRSSMRLAVVTDAARKSCRRPSWDSMGRSRGRKPAPRLQTETSSSSTGRTTGMMGELVLKGPASLVLCLAGQQSNKASEMEDGLQQAGRAMPQSLPPPISLFVNAGLQHPCGRRRNL
jgi:hypothetical protein